MNEVTRSNVSAWARRFAVKISNFEAAVEVADKVYGGQSRRGAIYVVAMKAVHVHHGIPMGSDVSIVAAAVVSDIVYGATYGEESFNAFTKAENTILKMGNAKYSDNALTKVREMAKALVDMASDAVNIRNQEKATPSLANMIISAARGN